MHGKNQQKLYRKPSTIWVKNPVDETPIAFRLKNPVDENTIAFECTCFLGTTFGCVLLPQSSTTNDCV